MNGTPAPATLDLREVLRLVLRRKVALLAPWGAALVLGTAAALLLPPVYISNVTMLLERPQALSGSLSGMVRPVDPERQAEVMRDQVQSSLFLGGVVSASGLKSDPETRQWALREAADYPGQSADEKIEAFLVDRLRQAITIRRGKGNVFQIQVEDSRADRARRFAEAVSQQFLTASKAQQIEGLVAIQEFSMQQQQLYKRKLEESEARLEAARRNVISTSLTGSAVTSGNLARARALLEQADLDTEEQRQRVRQARDRLAQVAASHDPACLSSPESQELAGQIRGLERQMAAAMLIGEDASDNSAMARLSSIRKMTELEIVLTRNAKLAFPNASPEAHDALVRFRLAEVDAQARESRRTYLAGQVGTFEQNAVTAPDRDATLQRLEAEVEANRTFYNSFVQQSAAAQITQAFENAKLSGRFVILEPANLPRAPGKPNRPMLIVMAFVLGGMIGAGSVLLAERQDQSMKNAEEVETLLGLPVIGAIPRVEELERSRRRRSRGSAESRDAGLLQRLKTETPLGLEFRRIYLKLSRARGQSLPATLLMTSSTRGEGKTTTTACLAITLARELGEKILLVDFDLRSPAMHRALGLPSSSWGLAQMLAQRKFDERFVRSTVLPNLDFLAAGRSERAASELVDTESVEWFLNEARSRYPRVIIDCAPNLAVPDPLIIGRSVEGVLYVIKAGQTIRKAAEYGVRVQREARDNLLGVLMNDAGDVLPHYYGYHDAYGYAGEAAGGES
jgi:capsular exopolysaccharide synthesis family protein